MDDDSVAAAVHETWRELARTEGWAMPPHLDRPHKDLADADKGNNLAAARRIPVVLARAGLGLRALSDGGLPDEDVRAILESRLELLAEAEHQGWMAHRASDGWTFAPIRDDARKLHPSMIPYDELPDSEKDKDRNNIRHYPEFAARAGYGIVRLR